MLAYDELIDGLESAWISAGLHEHALIETIQPDTLERSYRVELFPEHPEPLTEENIPPWVEVNFVWQTSHQLCAEGRSVEPDELDLMWSYMVFVRSAMRDYEDRELVRMFQRAMQAGLHRLYPNSSDSPEPIAVEIRRTYQHNGQRTRLAYVQVVGTRITDLSQQWNDPDPLALRRLLRAEINLASATIQALTDAFQPGGNGGYQSVDTA
jgi:hypothetical protein